MIDDRLYRYLIPGSLYLFALAGWLVADPDIWLVKLLAGIGAGGTSSASALVVAGSLIVVTIGFVCGEIGRAIGWPSPAVSLASKNKTESQGDDRLWWDTHVDLCHDGKNPDRSERSIFVIEALTVFTHAKLANVSPAMAQYLSRLWSRVVIGMNSIIALLLALLSYLLLHCMLSHEYSNTLSGYEWFTKDIACLPKCDVRFLPMAVAYLLVGTAIARTTYLVIEERQRLYVLLAYSDFDSLAKKSESKSK
jgi:hypothetical protein